MPELLLLTGGISALAGFAGCWAGRRIALASGLVSRPNPIVKQHQTVIPYLGGVGFVTGIVASAPLWLRSDRIWNDGRGVALLTGAVLFFVLGVIDDAWPFAPLPKLALQILVAMLVAFAVTGLSIGMSVVAAVLALWIVSLVNAVNFTDVSDGYATAIASCLFLGIAVVEHSMLGEAAGLAATGALVLNLPPARVFIGDAGSHVLGIVLALASLSGFDPHRPLVSIGESVLFCSPFLFELVFCTAVRARKGLSILRGSPDHVALRLQESGMTKTQAMLAGSAFAVASVAAAAGFRWNAGPIRLAILCGMLAAYGIAWRWLLRHEVSRKAGPSHG